MQLSVSLPAFAVAVLLISASPGPAMALMLRRTALHGMRTAVPLVLGLELGLYLWALAAAAGFAALVAASEAAYWALKLVGACVLVFLGVRAWLAAWRARQGAARAEPPADGGARAHSRRSPRGWSSSWPTRRRRCSWSPSTRSSWPSSEPLFRTTAVLALLQVCIELCF